jgi:hypothetical protein
MPNCEYCRHHYSSDRNLALHHRNKEACRRLHDARIRERANAIPLYDSRDPEQIPRDDEPVGGYEPPSTWDDDKEVCLLEDFEDSVPMLMNLPMDAEVNHTAASPPPSESPPVVFPSDSPCSPEATAMDAHVDDDEPPVPLFHRTIRYHPNRPQNYGRGKTLFEERKEAEQGAGDSPYGPFRRGYGTSEKASAISPR